MTTHTETAAPSFAPGTLVLVDTLTGLWVEPLGTDDEDEAEAILEALNGATGTRYSVDVA